jgi:Protein kinase domain
VDSPTTVGIGSEVLGYRIEARAGQGGMGVVYRAHDQRLKRAVALKLIAPDLALDERFRERFARESELAMALEHPHVVPIHDAGEFDGQLYLVMRFVEGTDLRSLLREEGALEPRRALAIVSQIANALDAAHAKGLVHRDVKPSNVLLDQSEHVYLADFGLTRRVADDGAQFTGARSLGTPAYLAPEQIEGGPVDGRADVYSLGCMLYECLTGEPPFVGPSRLAVAWAHLEEEPPRISERDRKLPEALDDVIGKALAKKPEDRYENCRGLVAEAEAALGLGSTHPWRRRAIALAAVMIAVAALAAAFVTRAGSEATTPFSAAPNTLMRVDPLTNTIAAVIDVGDFPGAVATAGQTVWVYNLADHTVSEIDARTNDVVRTVGVSTIPAQAGPGTGPSLAADSDGAWVVGRRVDGRALLTRVLSRGRGTREFRLNTQPEAVVVGEGAVWILAHDERSDLIIQVDQRTGAVLRRTRMPDGSEGPGVSAAERRATSGRLDGLAVGGGFVWASARSAGTLYRVDPTSGAVQLRDLGQETLRPAFGFGRIWLCVDGTMEKIDPDTLKPSRSGTGLGGEREYVPGFGSLWRHDGSSETLMRFDPRTGDLAGLTPMPTLERQEVLVTSLAAGAGGLWITIARFY